MEEPIHIVCENNGGSNHNPLGCSTPEPASVDLPEKKVVLFALCIAIIEFTTNGLRQLAFVWANVMLLGGFITNHKPIDFWFVTTILVVEGTRLFTRASELQWQQQSTLTLPANTSSRNIQSHNSIPFRLVGVAMRALFISSPRIVPYQMRQLDEGTTLSETKWTGLPVDDTLIPLLPYPGRKFVKTIRSLLYCLHLFPALACATFSLMRLVQQDYGDEAKKNEKSSINVFYSLAVAEALMFLLEMGYWIWRIEVQMLFSRVAKEYEFSPMSMGFLSRFFDDAYSKCTEGRFFDVSKMDLFSFADGLLYSNSPKERIMGVTILHQIVQHKTRLTDGTLEKIRNSTHVLKKLIEMLNWENPEEEKIRCLAFEIMSKLASDEQHALPGAANPEAMESIASLLHSGEESTDGRPYVASLTEIEAYDFSAFHQLGLLILEHLARDHDNENCLRIRNVPALFSRIVVLTSARKAQLRELVPEAPPIMTMHLALKVVKTLACAREKTGEILRRDISENKDLLLNIRDLLEYGESHLELQMLGLEILACLGKNLQARKKIENIEGMLTVILQVFFQPIETEEVGEVCKEAGEVLAMLTHESMRTCEEMLFFHENSVEKLVDAFSNQTLMVNTACMLRDLCIYSNHFSTFEEVVRLRPMVLKTIMEEKGEKEKEKEKILEVSIEFACQLLKFENPRIFGNQIEKAGIRDKDFAKKLMEVLMRYEKPERELPTMRISVIHLVMHLMKYGHRYHKLFSTLRMKQLLERIVGNVVEFEHCKLFSWSQRKWFEVNISNLIETTLGVLSQELKVNKRKGRTGRKRERIERCKTYRNYFLNI